MAVFVLIVLGLLCGAFWRGRREGTWGGWMGLLYVLMAPGVFVVLGRSQREGLVLIFLVGWPALFALYVFGRMLSKPPPSTGARLERGT